MHYIQTLHFNSTTLIRTAVWLMKSAKDREQGIRWENIEKCLTTSKQLQKFQRTRYECYWNINASLRELFLWHILYVGNFRHLDIVQNAGNVNYEAIDGNVWRADVGCAEPTSGIPCRLCCRHQTLNSCCLVAVWTAEINNKWHCCIMLLDFFLSCLIHSF